MFKIESTLPFDKKFRKLVKNNAILKTRILETLDFLSDNPKHPGLRTHQIDDSEYGKIWSSWVYGDLRIFWKYEGEQIVILLLDIGSRSYLLELFGFGSCIVANTFRYFPKNPCTKKNCMIYYL